MLFLRDSPPPLGVWVPFPILGGPPGVSGSPLILGCPQGGSGPRRAVGAALALLEQVLGGHLRNGVALIRYGGAEIGWGAIKGCRAVRKGVQGSKRGWGFGGCRVPMEPIGVGGRV